MLLYPDLEIYLGYYCLGNEFRCMRSCDSPDIELRYDRRSKWGHKGQKGQISENVANCLKHMQNQYLAQKTCVNHFLGSFLLFHSKLLKT